jgi:hypothetical protein
MLHLMLRMAPYYHKERNVDNSGRRHPQEKKSFFLSGSVDERRMENMLSTILVHISTKGVYFCG